MTVTAGELSEIVVSEGWRDFARCQGEPIEMFFGYLYETHVEVTNRERKAKAMCGLCPVREICLDYAIVNMEWGIWGGTNKKERDKIRQSRKKAERC